MINYDADGFLSICIPTYNRSDRLIEVINELLKFEHPDFRVVITDNNSTDDTFEKVSSLADSRIVYICNGTNIGTYKNLIQAHINGVSKYNLLLIDKDKFNAKYLQLLINKLLELESDFEMARLLYTSDETDNIVVKRLDNLYERLTESSFVMHPSAFLFSNSFFKKNNQYFSHLLNLKDWAPLYPHNLILLNFIENINYLHISMPRSANPIDTFYFRSLSYKYSSSYRPLFAGKDRETLINEFTLHLYIIENQNLSNKLKIKYLTMLIKSFLTKVTISKRYALMDPLLCSYYNVEPLKLGLKAMIKEGFLFIFNINRLLNGKYRICYSVIAIKTLSSILIVVSYHYFKIIGKYLIYYL